MYDTIGAAQFGVLTLFFGLRESHRLLEIGAGSLRAGRLLIPYLDAGHYCGVEPRRASIELGLEHALGREMQERKRPRFSTREDFCFDEFAETFDYLLSFSVLTHVPPSDIAALFAAAARCMHADSIFLVTACLREPERIVDPDAWTDGLNEYAPARIEEAVRRAGLRALRLGWLFQDWIAVFHEGNRKAAAGAEQMSRVQWHRVLPGWEEPADWKFGSRARRPEAARHDAKPEEARARPAAPGTSL